MRRFLIFLVLMWGMLAECQSGTTSADGYFSLKVGGESVEVIPFKNYYYASFDWLNPQTVELQPGCTISSVEISPKSRGITAQVADGKIRFQLDSPGYVMVRLNDTTRVFILAEIPETKYRQDETVNVVERYGVDNTGQTNITVVLQKAIDNASGSGKVLFFPAGIYKTGQLRIGSNTHLHLARGAVLLADTISKTPFLSTDEVSTRRFIYIRDAENVKITGLGTIDGNGTVLRSRFGDDARMRLVLAVHSKNIVLEGIQLKDPGSWNTQILLCEDVTIRRVKLLNNPKLPNTDGFDPDATKRMVIEDCFAYCGDDNVAIKQTRYAGMVGDVEDITIRGCVFLTQKSSLKVGTESQGERMKNILFENNDVLEADRGMALYSLDGSIYENIIYRNNRFERNYPDAQQKYFHFQAKRRNPDSRLGRLASVLIEDCSFLYKFPKGAVAEYAGDAPDGVNISIKNLTVAGEKITTPGEASIQIKNANIVFE